MKRIIYSYSIILNGSGRVLSISRIKVKIYMVYVLCFVCNKQNTRKTKVLSVFIALYVCPLTGLDHFQFLLQISQRYLGLRLDTTQFGRRTNEQTNRRTCLDALDALKLAKNFYTWGVFCSLLLRVIRIFKKIEPSYTTTLGTRSQLP